MTKNIGSAYQQKLNKIIARHNPTNLVILLLLLVVVVPIEWASRELAFPLQSNAAPVIARHHTVRGVTGGNSTVAPWRGDCFKTKSWSEFDFFPKFYTWVSCDRSDHLGQSEPQQWRQRCRRRARSRCRPPSSNGG